MIQKEVTAQVPEKKDKETGNVVQNALGPCTVLVNYPESLKEAGKWATEEAILSNAFNNWKVTLQGNIRSSLKAGFTPEQIQEKLSNAVMGVMQSGGRVDPQQAFIAKFKMASPEEQAKMIEQLKAAAGE